MTLRQNDRFRESVEVKSNDLLDERPRCVDTVRKGYPLIAGALLQSKLGRGLFAPLRRTRNSVFMRTGPKVEQYAHSIHALTDQLGNLSDTHTWRTAVKRIGHRINDGGFPGTGRASNGKQVEAGEINQDVLAEARESFDLQTNWPHRLAPRRARRTSGQRLPGVRIHTCGGRTQQKARSGRFPQSSLSHQFREIAALQY